MSIWDSPHHSLQEFPQMQPLSALQPTLSKHGFLIQKAKVPEFGPQNTSVLNFEMQDSYLTSIQDYMQPPLSRSSPVTCLLPPEPPWSHPPSLSPLAIRLPPSQACPQQHTSPPCCCIASCWLPPHHCTPTIPWPTLLLRLFQLHYSTFSHLCVLNTCHAQDTGREENMKGFF